MISNMSICSPWLQNTKNNLGNWATSVNSWDFFCIILEKSPCDWVDMPIDEENREDEQLLRLIREVLEFADGSPNQQQAMQELLKLIHNLKGIYKHNDPIIDYHAVFNSTLETVSIEKDTNNISGKYLRQFIKKFEIDTSNGSANLIRLNFVRRFNRILKNRITDIYRQLKKQPISLDISVSPDNYSITLLDTISSDETLTGIDAIIASELEERVTNIGQKIWNYIKQDPEHKLRNCHPREHVNGNCQELAIRLLLKNPPDSLTDIAKDLDINYQTLNAHWKRRCLPLLREIGQNFGYGQE